ncbi:hypothetical protein WMY93_031672 [Mugilogobius chulae]|uniref:Uncharacterized protein n=1 Tax=Mugilogobius chulae TaxID=88201 RepID=A0AAW0MF84_9GOBI
MNQPDIVVVDKEQRRAVVVDVSIPSDGNIRRKEHEKLEKYQGLREELEKAWKVKATVVPVVIVQKSAVLGTARILRRTLKLPGSGRGPELGKRMRPPAVFSFRSDGGRERDEAQRKEEEMILLLKKAKLSIHRDQLSSASSFLHQAVALAQQLHHQDALLYCYSLMANLSFVRGQLEQAEKLFKACLSLMLSGGIPENHNSSSRFPEAASIYSRHEQKQRPLSSKTATAETEQVETAPLLDLAEHGFRFCVETLEEKLEKDFEPSKEKPKEESNKEPTEEEEQRLLLQDTWLLLGLALDSRARFRTQTSDFARAEQDYRRSVKIWTAGPAFLVRAPSILRRWSSSVIWPRPGSSGETVRGPGPGPESCGSGPDSGPPGPPRPAVQPGVHPAALGSSGGVRAAFPRGSDFGQESRRSGSCGAHPGRSEGAEEPEEEEKRRGEGEKREEEEKREDSAEED